MVEAELAQQTSQFPAVVFGGVREQNEIVDHLLEPDSASNKMPLDVRKLHREGELERRRAEALRNSLRMLEFTGKEALQPPVRKRVQVPRRRPEMHLDADTVQLLRKMNMVARDSQTPLRLDVKFLARLVSREEEGTRRFGRHHPEFLQEGHDLLAPAIDPDVDIAALPHKLVRVQARVGRPLQDGGTPPLLLEKFGKVRGLGIYQAVMSADSLRFASPLERKVQRRPPVLRQLADARIRDAHYRELGRQGIQKRPLFGGLYVKICRLPLTRTECEPNEGEEMFVDVLFH